MDIHLQFLGAARNVTGACTLVRAGGRSILVDCGMFQERELRERNWAPFPVDPAALDAVLLTHAHLDHCGLLPKLVRDGFHGPVYCTPATAELARIVLLDSAHIQEEDALLKRERHEREGRQRAARGAAALHGRRRRAQPGQLPARPVRRTAPRRRRASRPPSTRPATSWAPPPCACG